MSRNARVPLLAATLIVKDEAESLPDCLESLRPFVDETVVYDTGSTDGTQGLARAAGARVVQGFWDGDFARARNAALRLTRATWVLIVDADERVQGDPAGLRSYLRGSAHFSNGAPSADQLDLIWTQVVNVGHDDLDLGSMISLRLARRQVVQWRSPIHEQLLVRGVERGRERSLRVAPGLLSLRHLGYADPDLTRQKLLRNLAIAQQQLDALVASDSHDVALGAKVLLDLGRSMQGLGRRQEAVEAYETLRELVPDGGYREQGTGHLAQLLLDEGGFDEVALFLARELHSVTATATQYCDWLCAQALNRLGRRGEALTLLRGIDRVVDPIGNVLNLGPALVTRALLAVAEGELDEAADALLIAMVEYGDAMSQAGLLLELWHDRRPELAQRLSQSEGRHLNAVLSQLAARGGAGTTIVAQATGARRSSLTSLP